MRTASACFQLSQNRPDWLIVDEPLSALGRGRITNQQEAPSTDPSTVTGSPHPRAGDCMVVCISKESDPVPSAPEPAHRISLVVLASNCVLLLTSTERSRLLVPSAAVVIELTTVPLRETKGIDVYAPSKELTRGTEYCLSFSGIASYSYRRVASRVAPYLAVPPY